MPDHNIRHSFETDALGHNIPTVNIVMFGKSTSSVSASALLDTGSSMTLVLAGFARALGFVHLEQFPQRRIVGISGGVTASVATLPRMHVGSIELLDVEIGFVPALGQFQVLLGQSGVLESIWLRHQSHGAGRGFFSFGLRTRPEATPAR